MRTNSDLTVYNRYIVDGDEVWQLFHVLNVMWEDTKAVNILKSGLMSADSVIVFIPRLGRMSYVFPKEWVALTDKSGFWTLQPGDTLVKGLVTDVIGPTFTISDLNRKYGDVVNITTIDRLDMGSPALWHWRVGAS